MKKYFFVKKTYKWLRCMTCRMMLWVLMAAMTATALQAQTDAPPTVNIVSPLNGSIVSNEQVTITYEVTGGAPSSVRISVDDRAVQLITDAQLGENTAIIDIPDRNSVISIVARNAAGASAAATVSLVWQTVVFKPSLYILAIGISNYDDPGLRLQFPAKDASDFSRALMQQAGLLFESVDVRLLVDRRASAEGIRDGLQWLQTETTNRDLAMLFFAGHGVNNNVGDFFFMPVNADKDRINATCVGYAEFKAAIDAIPGKLLLFMDACHSGNVLGST